MTKPEPTATAKTKSALVAKIKRTLRKHGVQIIPLSRAGFSTSGACVQMVNGRDLHAYEPTVRAHVSVVGRAQDHERTTKQVEDALQHLAAEGYTFQEYLAPGSYEVHAAFDPAVRAEFDRRLAAKNQEVLATKAKTAAAAVAAGRVNEHLHSLKSSIESILWLSGDARYWTLALGIRAEVSSYDGVPHQAFFGDGRPGPGDVGVLIDVEVLAQLVRLAVKSEAS